MQVNNLRNPGINFNQILSTCLNFNLFEFGVQFLQPGLFPAPKATSFYNEFLRPLDKTCLNSW